MRGFLAIGILFFLIRASKGSCDEKKCKVGISVGAGVCHVAGGILTAVAGLATSGAGWGVGAAITVGACKGLSTTKGACVACSSKKPPNLEKVMQEQEENFEHINNKLEEIHQATKELKAGIELSHIIGLYGSDLRNLETVSEKFQNVQKHPKGTLISDWRADDFEKAAMDAHDGVLASVDNIHKMLVGGHVLKPKSLWKTLPAMCNQETRDYFLRLISQAYIHLSIALAMQGRMLNKDEIEDLKLMMIKIQHIFNKDCGCQTNEVLSTRPNLQFLAQDHTSSPGTRDDLTFMKELTSKTKDWQTIRKLTLLYSARRFELTDEIIARVPLQRPVEDFELLSRLEEGNNLNDLHLFQDKCVCYAKVEGGSSDLIPVSAHMSSSKGGKDNKIWSAMNCIDNRISTGCQTLDTDKNPWVALDFGEEVFVSQVTVNNRPGFCKRFKNVEVLLGDGHTPGGETLGIFSGPATENEIIKIKAPTQAGVKGRFLHIQMKRSVMNLMEITAYGRRLISPAGIPGSNDEKLQPVSSSISSQYKAIKVKASRCHDGNKYNYCQTLKEKYPWFALDLGKPMKVRRITIFNRSDGHGSRLKDVEVQISNQVPTTAAEPFRGGTKLGFFEGPGKNGEAITLVAERPLPGRYVVIIQNYKGKFSANYMNLGEVTVVGNI
eukprot:GFUD01012109.1.p1 GENE.GFUD01012109.1~~GFUD01012109.1.p1  ORF type:complete len:665 (+),score=119.74 GFUD01012109.1:399-2393(+)